jgi:hypothetical protein
VQDGCVRAANLVGVASSHCHDTTLYSMNSDCQHMSKPEDSLFLETRVGVLFAIMKKHEFGHLSAWLLHTAVSLKFGVTQNACSRPQLPASTIDQVTGSDVLFLASLLANMPHRTVFRHVSSLKHILHVERHVPRPLH